MNNLAAVIGTVKFLKELSNTERAQLKALHKELIDYEYQYTPSAMQYVFNQLETVDESLEEIIQVIDFVYFLTRTDTMEMIGFLAVNQGEPYEIAALYVKEEFRGNAFGSVMVAKFASMTPLNPITVNCFEKNERAMDFYRGMGFTFSPHSRGHSVHYGVRGADLAAKAFPEHAGTMEQLASHMNEVEQRLTGRLKLQS